MFLLTALLRLVVFTPYNKILIEHYPLASDKDYLGLTFFISQEIMLDTTVHKSPV
jgi:hypothetical protein